MNAADVCVCVCVCVCVFRVLEGGWLRLGWMIGNSVVLCWVLLVWTKSTLHLPEKSML